MNGRDNVCACWNHMEVIFVCLMDFCEQWDCVRVRVRMCPLANMLIQQLKKARQQVTALLMRMMISISMRMDVLIAIFIPETHFWWCAFHTWPFQSKAQKTSDNNFCVKNVCECECAIQHGFPIGNKRLQQVVIHNWVHPTMHYIWFFVEVVFFIFMFEFQLFCHSTSVFVFFQAINNNFI